jgi:hypothetical protein
MRVSHPYQRNVRDYELTKSIASVAHKLECGLLSINRTRSYFGRTHLVAAARLIA